MLSTQEIRGLYTPGQFHLTELQQERYSGLGEMETAAKEANELLGLMPDLPPTLLVPARLALFNTVRNTAGASQEFQEAMRRQTLARLVALSSSERRAANPEVLLPTVGVELESADRAHDAVSSIQAMNVPNYRELNEAYHEVPAPYSYTTAGQKEILRQLAELGFVPVSFDNEQLVIGPKQSNSLHMNYGASPGVTGRDLRRLEQRIYGVNDVLGYAFVNPTRLRTRKTREAIALEGDGQHSAKSRSDSQDNSSGVARVELRLGSFSGKETYYALDGGQGLLGMMFANIRANKGLAESPRELQLAAQWERFLADVDQHLSPYGVGANYFDMDPQRAIDMIEDGTVPDLSRRIIAHHIGQAQPFFYPQY